MNGEFIEIACPDCKTILIVRRRDGKLMETRKPILEDSTGDRFEDAMLKVRHAGAEVEKKVKEAREREQSKMDRLNALFKEGLKKAQEEGPVSKPKREMDLD
jgi:hypothetical protein